MDCMTAREEAEHRYNAWMELVDECNRHFAPSHYCWGNRCGAFEQAELEEVCRAASEKYKEAALRYEGCRGLIKHPPSTF